MRDEPGVAAIGEAFEQPQLCPYFSELSPLPLVVVEGPTHIVRYLNEAFAQLVGNQRAELMGRPFAEAVPEGNDNRCIALLDHVYRTGTAENFAEQPHRHTPPAYWSYAAWAILGFDARPAGVIFQVTDVTDTAVFRGQLTGMNEALLLSSIRQHELTDTAEKLNDTLRVSTIEYRRLFETSQEQATALTDLHFRKDEFLAMLSHELRSPLAPIANAVELLRLEPNESPLQQQARTIIERQVTQLTRLVDDLMEVSRITTGRVQLRLERVIVNGIVERAVETARPLIDSYEHQLTVSLSPLAIWLLADAARLEQVVVNLLTNAAKYTDKGGRIWLEVEQAGNEAVIHVRDTGVGIAADLLPHIFDMFTQAERSLDRSQGGLGIGLALVQRLVEMHHGRVEAHSTLGQGSEFVVHLPAMSPAVLQPEATIAVVRPIKSGCRVLVVDDNVDSANSLGMLLKVSGHQIRTVYDGPSALVAALDFRPDVVLLDIGLPGMDGYEVARKLRQQPGHKQLVLIALTGYGQESDRRCSREAGFDQHLVKPADFRKLQEMLATVAGA